LDVAQWAPWEGAAATAIFSLSIKSLRLKSRIVNTKPSQKYFVKLQCVSRNLRQRRN
jgi:hypothetical protein